MFDFYRVWLPQIWARTIYWWAAVHRSFGNQTKYQRDHKTAIRLFSRAYSVDPNLNAALLSRGILYWRELNDPEKALTDFSTLLEKDDAFGPALLNRAMVLQEQGRFADARLDLEKYMALPYEEIADYEDVAQRALNNLRILIDDGNQTAA